MNISARKTTALATRPTLRSASRTSVGDGGPADAGARSVGRAAQFRSGFRFRRFGSRFRFDRLDFGALDPWRLEARGCLDPRRFGRTLRRRPQRTRPGHRPRQQHLRGALVMEIAIGEAHARDRSAEVSLVSLVEIEARLERNALDRRADGLAADLKRIAGKAHVVHRTGARELHRACGTTVVEYPASAAGAIEAGKCEYLAVYELAGLIGIHHLSGQ